MRVNILSFVLLSGSVLPALIPAHADAKAIEEIQLSADENDLVISVMADEPLRTPTIRTGSGVVRVRFYDVQTPTPSKISGDGTALRQVDLVRGSDGTAALAVLLGDHTKLAPADVRVEPDGDVTNLRIARGLLPPLGESANIATAPSAQPAQQPAAQAAPQAAPAEQPAPVPVPAPSLGKPSKAEPEPMQKLTSGDPSSPVVPVLITVTVMLALSYVGLQLVLKKRRNFGTDIPIIDVVAHQRLGPKHQLVIVRAFDRDYLLSVQGGQTTVVARSSRKKAAMEAAAAVAAVTGESTAAARRADLTTELRNSSRDFEEDDEPTFGGELFKHALEQRERARESTLSASQAIERARTQSQAASLSRDSQSGTTQRARDAVATLIGSDRPRESPFSFPPERAKSERPERSHGERPERAHSERVRISEPRSDFAAHLELDRGNGAGDDGRILGNDTRSLLASESARPRPRTVSERVLASDPLVSGETELPGESKISDSVSGLLRLRKQAGR